MKYVVRVGYKKFEFEDSITAMTFAELAQANVVPSEYDNNNEVSIELENEKGGQENA